MSAYLLRIRNAAQVARVCVNRERSKCGKEMASVEVLENASIVVGLDGKIVAVDRTEVIDQQFGQALFQREIDATRKSVIPGLVDAHTHPVWSGDRVHEFAMKLAGATYLDIHKAGGGIGFTVRHTRESSETELAQLLQSRLNRMLRLGSTLIEGKSGYGLSLDSELKLLRVLHASKHAVEIVSNFCGAHSVPVGMTAQQAAADVIERQLPAVLQANARGETSAELVDVFFERGVFERDEAAAILRAGRAAGLELNFHGDELNPNGAGELAAELGALAVSHLEHVRPGHGPRGRVAIQDDPGAVRLMRPGGRGQVSEEGIQRMAACTRPVVAVLLPTTAFVLRIAPPPARKLIEGGVPVALGSDFNPNAHCLSMPHVMNLACVMMRMTMEEALVAATINAAASVNRSTMYGSIEVGKWADFVIVDSPRWEHIIYEIVDPPIAMVIKKGRVVYSSDTGLLL